MQDSAQGDLSWNQIWDLLSVRWLCKTTACWMVFHCKLVTYRLYIKPELLHFAETRVLDILCAKTHHQKQKPNWRTELSQLVVYHATVFYMSKISLMCILDPSGAMTQRRDTGGNKKSHFMYAAQQEKWCKTTKHCQQARIHSSTVLYISGSSQWCGKKRVADSCWICALDGSHSEKAVQFATAINSPRSKFILGAVFIILDLWKLGIYCLIAHIRAFFYDHQCHSPQ